MTDYIKREDARKAACTFCCYDALCSKDGDCPLGEKLQTISTADVRENVHGRWIKLDMHRGMEQYKCSACGQSCYVPECMCEPMYAYCPNCGAQILGENDDI